MDHEHDADIYFSGGKRGGKFNKWMDKMNKDYSGVVINIAPEEKVEFISPEIMQIQTYCDYCHSRYTILFRPGIIKIEIVGCPICGAPDPEIETIPDNKLSPMMVFSQPGNPGMPLRRPPDYRNAAEIMANDMIKQMGDMDIMADLRNVNRNSTTGRLPIPKAEKPE